ncbi:MAG: hypothetical protein WCI61_04095 [Chloroflexota bacterium]
MPTALPTSIILYEHDDDGVPFAVEEIHAARWESRFALPPDPFEADVRVVHLAAGPLPCDAPRWLAVDLGPARLADGGHRYVVQRDGTPDHATPRRLWDWSPHHRGPSAALDEFLLAGATALRYPDPPPLDADRQAEALRAFARGVPALERLILHRAVALQRWLHVAFGEPEGFAEAILLARIEATAPGDAALMRFLRAAVVPHRLGGAADLAVDRMVLLEQASPWRALEGASMTAAFAAAQSWQRRYRRAYAEHYRRAVVERDALLHTAEAAEARCATLARLNTITALGAPEGAAALATARDALDALVAMPRDPDAEAATTAGVLLGEPNARAAAYRAATEAVEHALARQLRRLSGALAACALRHDDDLRAILDAVALSEVDHLDRVLDERLAGRIDALLTAAARSPLTVVAHQFPEVTLANLEAAVEEFRRAALHAIDASPDGRTPLGVAGSLRLAE